MKKYLGIIPPLTVITSATIAWAQSTSPVVPVQDLTSIIAGVGTGGLTIWFCLKWVQSELARNDERLTALKDHFKAEHDKLVTEAATKIAEVERRAQVEHELRLQDSKDYADRMKELSQQQITNLQMALQVWRERETGSIQRDPNQQPPPRT